MNSSVEAKYAELQELRKRWADTWKGFSAAQDKIPEIADLKVRCEAASSGPEFMPLYRALKTVERRHPELKPAKMRWYFTRRWLYDHMHRLIEELGGREAVRRMDEVRRAGACVEAAE